MASSAGHSGHRQPPVIDLEVQSAAGPNYLARGSIACASNRCSVTPRVADSKSAVHPNIFSNASFGFTSPLVARELHIDFRSSLAGSAPSRVFIGKEDSRSAGHFRMPSAESDPRSLIYLGRVIGCVIWPGYLDATAGPSSGSTRMMPAMCVLPTQNLICAPESSTKARRMFVSRGIR